MRKIIVLLIFFNCVYIAISAQVQIQTMLPTVGLVQKNQLWNLVLINSSGASKEGRIELVLFNRKTSQELMTASTSEFSLTKGSVLININKLEPISYNYIGIEPDKNINTLLPVGAYTVCYSFVLNPSTNKRETLVEECVSFDVEPLSPPMLSFPADSAILETAPTQFAWTPPVPATLLNRLHYEVVITEIQSTQKATEAISDNVPFFSHDQTPNNFMTYTGAQPNFEKDKWYAWQVTAKDDNNYAGKTEVWVFKISTATPKISPVNDVYLLLEEGLKGTYQVNAGILHIKYFSRDKDYEGQILFSDEKGNTVKSLKQKIVQGDNYLDFPLNNRFQSNTVYSLTLLDSNNKRHTLTFSINTK